MPAQVWCRKLDAHGAWVIMLAQGQILNVCDLVIYVGALGKPSACTVSV